MRENTTSIISNNGTENNKIGKNQEEDWEPIFGWYIIAIDAIKKSDRVIKEASDEQRDSLSKCTMQEIFKSPCLYTIDFMLSQQNE